MISATQCAEVAPAAPAAPDKASDSDDVDLFASDDDDAPVTKPKLVKPAPRPQQEVSKKQAKKTAKTEKKSAAKAAKQQAAAVEDEDMEVLDETSLYFIPPRHSQPPQREANCSRA